MKPLLLALWAMFVLGGFVMSYTAVENFAALEGALPSPARPVTATTPAAAATPVAAPSLAGHPPLRDFDQSPPPFAAAGQPDAQPAPRPKSPVGRLTILLMGIDQRPNEAVPGGDPGRTDSMVLVSIDFDAHVASMVSIPRDGFIVIPGHGNERVNAAYTFGELDKPGGGPALAMETVSQVFGIPVDRYALIDIHSMQQVIDTLGGVWIDNPTRLIDWAYPTDDYRTITIDIPAGRQLMDGATAVEYARTRHPDSDYGRQARQQQLLLAIRDQALQLGVLTKVPTLIPQLLQLVHTDLSAGEILDLVNFGRTLDRGRDIVTLAPDPNLTPAYAGRGGASYIHLTPAYLAQVKALVEEPRVVAERAQIDVYNAGAPVGSGGAVASILGRAGLLVSKVTTAPRVATTRVETGSGARETAAMVAKALRLSSDALIVTDDSSSVTVLLGPDTRLPTG